LATGYATSSLIFLSDTLLSYFYMLCNDLVAQSILEEISPNGNLNPFTKNASKRFDVAI
jgi:hypothetical protein